MSIRIVASPLQVRTCAWTVQVRKPSPGRASFWRLFVGHGDVEYGFLAMNF